MIVAFIVYALVVGLLVSVAAAAIERGLAAIGVARRGVWAMAMFASIAIPSASMFVDRGQNQESTITVSAVDSAAPQQGDDEQRAPASNGLIRRPLLESIDWPALLRWDALLIITWTLTGVGMAMFIAIAAVGASRAARRWPERDLDGFKLRVSPDVGPAVIGIVRPQIVVPEWFCSSTGTTRRLALEHERQHIQARDPLLLVSAFALLVLAPWNIALWWQWRRLRFAVEVDCDSRVVSRGGDPRSYGNVLLNVSRIHTRARVSALGFNERRSDLERRIRILLNARSRFGYSILVACALTGMSLVAVAAQINAPTPPQFARLSAETQRELLERHFPDTVSGTENSHRNLWLLLDRADRVVLSGRNPFDAESTLAELTMFYPQLMNSEHISTSLSELFDGQIVDAKGRPVVATFAWLTDAQKRTGSSASRVRLETKVLLNGTSIAIERRDSAFGETVSTELHNRLRIETTLAQVSDTEADVRLMVKVRSNPSDGLERARVVGEPNVRVKYGESSVLEQIVRYPDSNRPAEIWQFIVSAQRI